MNTYRITGYDLLNTDRNCINTLSDGDTPIEALSNALGRKLSESEILPKGELNMLLWMYDVQLWHKNGEWTKQVEVYHFQLKDDFAN